MSYINVRNINGPKTATCGTPDKKCNAFEQQVAERNFEEKNAIECDMQQW